MSAIPDPEADYSASSSALCGAHRNGQLATSQLLAKAAEAALDLETRGVLLSECWRNDSDWQTLARIALICASVTAHLATDFSRKNSELWRTRKRRIASIKIVSGS